MENEFWNQQKQRDHFDPFRLFLSDKENKIDKIKSMCAFSITRKQTEKKPFLKFGWNFNRANNQQGNPYWYNAPGIQVQKKANKMNEFDYSVEMRGPRLLSEVSLRTLHDKFLIAIKINAKKGKLE